VDLAAACKIVAPAHQGAIRLGCSRPTRGMAIEEHDFALSRRGLRPSFCANHPRTNRGRRESRVLDAPAASRAKVIKHTSVVTTGSPEIPSLPCAMVLTAYFALSPVTGLVCHRRSRIQPATLTPASGRQDHTTSPSASASLVLRRQSVHRIPPNVRDDGQRPSLGRDGGSCRSDLPDGLSEIFLQMGLDSKSPTAADLPVGQITARARRKGRHDSARMPRSFSLNSHSRDPDCNRPRFPTIGAKPWQSQQ
jgi:hypothetical protein